MQGIPTLIFPQTEKEDAFIATFLEAGCGIRGSVKKDEFVNQFKSLREDKSLRYKMSNAGEKLIDGLGAKRIVQEIDEFSQRMM